MAVTTRSPPHSRRLLLFAGLGMLLLSTAGWLYLVPVWELDLLIVNGLVIDGTGGPPRRLDVAVREGKVVALSRWRLLFSRAKLKLDARDKIVAPGFIDVHTHVEANLPTSEVFLPANFLRQGVTTMITGNCGRSRLNIAETLRHLDQHGTTINVASFIGHNTIRREVMGTAARQPTPEELMRMKQLVKRAMEEGALGLSTGLAYLPGRFAEAAEVTALARVVAKYDGLYVSHIRNEASEGTKALREALNIGVEAGTRLHISHFKTSGPTQWHTMAQRLALLDAAREKGQAVTIDAYPYNRSSTTTDVLLPDWAVEENRAGLRQVAQDAQARAKLHADILLKLSRDGWQDLTHVLIAWGRPEWIGHTPAEIPQPAATFAQQIENLIEISLRGGAQAIYADLHDDDVEQAITYEFGVFGSDSAVRDPENQAKPHPRGSGTFPRVFRHYVREKNLLSLSAAIHKASGFAAEIFQLDQRGHLRTGEWADIVIFDAEKIADGADYEHPLAEPSGIAYVMVNGVIVVDHGALTGNQAAGQALRKRSSAGGTSGE